METTKTTETTARWARSWSHAWFMIGWARWNANQFRYARYLARGGETHSYKGIVK